ncbi:hypothetical protein M413DRAFT_49537, partial [Hebeloma cylindrosporum]
VSSLAPHSEPLSTIFAIPASTSEEGTESNPIVLEGISAEDFSNFIRWVYHIDWNPVTVSEAVYLGIINVCQLYFIESGMKFAVHGLQAYAILAQAREAIDHEVRLIAACTPPFVSDPSWKCTNHALCTKAWKDVWWNIIGRALLHPMRPTHLSDLMDLI